MSKRALSNRSVATTARGPKRTRPAVPEPNWEESEQDGTLAQAHSTHRTSHSSENRPENSAVVARAGATEGGAWGWVASLKSYVSRTVPWVFTVGTSSSKSKSSSKPRKPRPAAAAPTQRRPLAPRDDRIGTCHCTSCAHPALPCWHSCLQRTAECSTFCCWIFFVCASAFVLIDEEQLDNEANAGSTSEADVNVCRMLCDGVIGIR